MRLSPIQKKSLGIVLVVVFSIIELLFLSSFVVAFFFDDRADNNANLFSTSFTMALFLFPIVFGVRLWRAGKIESSVARIEISPDTIIKLRTRIERKAYIALLYRLSYTNPAIIFAHFIAIAFLASYFFGTLAGHWAVAILFFLVYFSFAVYKSANANYKATKRLHETIEYEFTSRQITISGESFYSNQQWDVVHRFRETKDFFLLYENKITAILLPKSSFENDEQRRVFKNLALKSTIGT